MVYFRKQEITCPDHSKEELESLIKQKSAKVKNSFDFESTLGYVIHTERPLAGKQLKSGDVIVSRYRHSLFFFAPRIVTKWRIESKENSLLLITENRFSFLSTLGFVILSLACIIPLITALVKLSPPKDISDLWGPFMLVSLFIALTYYELITTKALLKKIIQRQEIKNIFTI